jgi:hypothetical protein
MARCASCGTENKGDVRFCRQCGRMLESAATPPADSGPVAVVVGETSLPKRGLIIGLVLAGLAAATGVGYFIGIRSVGSPSVQTEAASEATHAASAGSTRTTKPATHPSPTATAPAASTEAESPSENLAKLRQELAGCGKYNVFCQEKARWRHCKELWGTVPECPQAKANIPTN